MLVTNEQEALFIACEMEKRAIRLYQRAGMVLKDPAMRAMAQAMEKDESEHLARFRQMGRQLPEQEVDEQQLLLSAYAAQILFSGGLMEALRENAFVDELALATFARDGEKTAVQCYESFAQSCQSPLARDMFAQIAAEERHHHMALEERIAELQTEG